MCSIREAKGLTKGKNTIVLKTLKSVWKVARKVGSTICISPSLIANIFALVIQSTIFNIGFIKKRTSTEPTTLKRVWAVAARLALVLAPREAM